MLRLYVMRHAKSSWAIPGASDIDRELNDRGQSDLELVSRQIRKRQLFPKKILCSPSVRTRQTLEGISDAIRPQPMVEYVERLYSGGLEDYLDTISTQGDCESLMTIGHNPMSGTLASSIAGDGNKIARDLIAYKYPTATIAILDFDMTNWSHIRDHHGTLVDCIIPSNFRDAEQ